MRHSRRSAGLSEHRGNSHVTMSQVEVSQVTTSRVAVGSGGGSSVVFRRTLSVVSDMTMTMEVAKTELIIHSFCAAWSGVRYVLVSAN